MHNMDQNNRLSAAIMFCSKRHDEMPKRTRKTHYKGGRQTHRDAIIWKMQELVDKLNETIQEKWQ